MNAKVFLVDDDDAVRRGLTEILTVEGLEVVPYADAETFLGECNSQSAGCILLDIRLPGVDGLQAQEILNARNIELPVIFLTGHGDVPLSVRAMKAGAYDFLQKPVVADSLLARVYGALRLDERRRRQHEKSNCAKALIAFLTPREKEIFELLLDGMSNKEVAKKLALSPRTVEIHRKNIFTKTHASSVVELAELKRRASGPSSVSTSDQ